MEQQKQPALPPVEQETLISGKIVGILKRILYNGFPVAARFTKSVRVGSGTGLVGLDGTDGIVVVNSASGGFVMGDQNTPNGSTYAEWYENTSVVYLYSSLAGGTIWAINATNGYIAQPAFTAATRVANTGALAGFNAARYRRVLPTGGTELDGSIVATVGTIAAGTTLFTLPAGYFRTDNRRFIGTVYNAGAYSAGTFIVNSSGQVQLDIALTTTIAFIFGSRWENL